MIKMLFDITNKNNNILEYKEIDHENISKIKYESDEKLKNFKKEEILLPTPVIAINNFKAQEHDQLEIKKDELLFVTNWNCKNKGYVYGYRKDKKEEKGMFPEVLIKRCKKDNIG